MSLDDRKGRVEGLEQFDLAPTSLTGSWYFHEQFDGNEYGLVVAEAQTGHVVHVLQPFDWTAATPQGGQYLMPLERMYDREEWRFYDSRKALLRSELSFNVSTVER